MASKLARRIEGGYVCLQLTTGKGGKGIVKFGGVCFKGMDVI